MSHPFSSAAHNSQQDTSINSPTSSTSRNTRGQQQSVWGISSQQQPRRGLTPLSTGHSSAQQRSSTSSPSRNPFSPTNSTFNPPFAAANKQVSSRHSSVSSSSSLFSPIGQTGQQVSSSRPRNLPPSGSPHLPSSGGTFASIDRSGVGGTGSSRFARQSPSLSGSTAGSPVSASGPSSVGGSGQLTSLVITQLNILLSTLKEDKDKSKWEIQAEKIRKLVDAGGMEVFTQYFRRLLQSNAGQIFSTSSARPNDGAGGSYQLLLTEVQKLNVDADQAQKIAESLDTTDGDPLKDFDLSGFMDHFRLNPVAKVALAVSCKTVSKPDIKAKADAILSSNFDNFLAALSEPIDIQEPFSPTYIATILDRLIHNPPQGWNEDRRSNLQYVLRLRYNRLGVTMPYAVAAAMLLGELLSGQYPLVRLIQQSGPKASQGLEPWKDVLARTDANSVGYGQVANALLYMAIAHGGEKYDSAAFVAALRQHRLGQRIDWSDVLTAFDRPDVRVTKPQFLSLYNALLPVAKENEAFDIQGLWGNAWTHPETQLSFVVAFLSTNASELDVTQVPRMRSAYNMEEFNDTTGEVKDFASKAVLHPMVSYDATQALFTIIFSSQEAYNSAQTLGIPEAVINANTDIFVCAASAVGKPWAPLQEQALKQLFAPFFHKALPNHSFVMHALWTHDKTWLAGRLIEQYNTNQRTLGLTFEHAQEHAWIDALAGVRNDFGLDFTALAHSRGLVDFDKWTQDHVANNAVPANELSRAIISFLKFKIDDEVPNHNPTTVPLKVNTVFAMLNVIQETVTEQEEAAIQRSAIQAYPRLINYGYNFDHILDANGEAGNALSETADAKMQEEYKDMYGGDADARKMISTLRSLKDSDISEDQELFACMIHGLFDEYNCFGEYPLEALATTAVLFGGIINYGILHSRITLSVALYMVVDAVTEYGPEDSMYKFGLQALLHFMGRLEEWPSLCERLCRIPGLRGTEVQSKAEEVIRRQANLPDGGPVDDPLAQTNGTMDDLSEPAYQPFASIHADAPLRSDIYEEPDEETSDKVMFVLNNVSKRNLDEKFKDLKSALKDEHHQWFAHYLVEDLVKAQPNYQALYLQMLTLFDMNILWAEVLRETYVSIARIINAESTLSNSNDRGNLKNLAGWLGLLTLARDKPVMHRNLSFKDLLIEAHTNQRLLIAIPFTCKVLTQASRSAIFKPPNPWIMELLGLLMELYHFAELKLNLKFEIEVLCKELDLDHKNLEPLDIIRSLPLASAEESFLQQYAPESDGFGDMLSLSKRANDRFSASDVMKSLPDLGNLLHYPPAPGNVSQLQLKNVFQMAAQRAIQEIISPVVDRSVTIAAISTSQLVEKDFAMEIDEDRMRQSAYNVVKALSGSLALVTCKEPLRMSMSNNIRLLANQHLPDQLPEGSILMFVNDNLDTVCKLVEDSAENYSMAEIDAQLEHAIEARRRHRQQRPNEPFNEPPVSRWAFFIPEPYRQEQGGLNPQQLSIYEDFGRNMRLSGAHATSTSQDSNRQLPDVLSDNYLPNLPTPAGEPALPRQPVQQQQRLGGPPSLQSQQSHPQVNGYADPADVGRRVDELIGELQMVSRESEEDRISLLPANSPTREVYEALVHLIESSVQRDQLAMYAGQRATGLLYTEAKKRLEIEVFVQFLNQLCAMSVSTARQLIMYLSTLEDERALNAIVTVSLVRAMLIDLHHVDIQVTKAASQRRLPVLDFFNEVIDELLLSEHPGALRADFVLAYSALAQWSTEEPSNTKVKEILTKLEQSTRVPDGLPTPSAEEEKHNQLEYVFEEWVQLQRSDVPERTIAAFIHQLRERKVVTTRDDLALWCRICIDAAVDGYEREETLPFGIIDHAYINVDAFAKLVASLVSFSSEAEGDATTDGKLKHLEQTLCFVVLVMNHHHHTRQERFNERVFYRFFSSLLIELYSMRMHFSHAWTDVPAVIGEALLALQPQHFPGFAFAWVSLISHRMLVMNIMRSTGPKGYEVFTKLICALFSYIGDLSHTIETSVIAQEFYKAAVRVVYLLQHDYPDYLAANHVQLNSAIPTGFVQLNNLIGYANPGPVQELPDPFTPGLKINRLEQVRQNPEVTADLWEILTKGGIKNRVDKALNSNDLKPEQATAIITGIEALPEAKRPLLINALMVFIASAATVASSTFSASSIPAKLIECLLTDAQPELRYQIISAMVNQIRFPNSHTHWCSTAILHYFTITSEDVQQQLARVLIERLVVNRPYPWGLIVTILELIKNPNYNIFEQRWMKSAPDVERMLINLAQVQSGSAQSPEDR